MANNKKAKKVWADLKSGKMSVNELNNVLLESASLMKELVAVIKEEIASDKECFAKSVDGLKKAMESLENIANSGNVSDEVRKAVCVDIHEIAMKMAELQNKKQENAHDFKCKLLNFIKWMSTSFMFFIAIIWLSPKRK